LGRERRLELVSNENRQYNGDNTDRPLQPFLNFRPPRLWSPAASIEVDCRPQPPPMPIMSQPPSLANYLVESAFAMPMGSPPNFISPPLAPPLNLSPNGLFPIGAMRCGEGNCLVGSPQRDSIGNNLFIIFFYFFKKIYQRHFFPSCLFLKEYFSFFSNLNLFFKIRLIHPSLFQFRIHH